MANRYLVGLGAGPKTWNSSNTNLWSSTSGGASGASVPTASDDVFFDGNSGSANVLTLSGTTLACNSLTCTGFTGSVVATSADYLNVFGNVNLGTTGTFTGLGGMIFIICANCNLTSGGRSPNALFYNLTGGAILTLQDDLTTYGTHPQNGLYIGTAGATINTNGKTVVVSYVGDLSGGSYTFGTSTITAKVSFFLHSSTTLSAASSTVVIDAGGGTLSDLNFFSPWNKTFGTVRFTNGAFAFNATTDANQASMTCNMLQLDSGVTVNVASGYVPTWTITNLTMTNVAFGTASLPAPSLVCTSGTKTATGGSIGNSTVSGGATFIAQSAANLGGNSGWTFRNFTGFARTPRLTYLRR